MATETIRPVSGDTLSLSSLSGTFADIDDDPDSPDGNYLDPSGNNTNVDARTTFSTPTGNPTVGDGLQEFRVEVGQFDTGQSGNPDARIELWENGVLVRAGSNVEITGASQVIAFTWNANELATANGSLVECKVVGTKSGGSPSARNSVKIGAIEWNVTYSVGSTTYDETLRSLTIASVTSSLDNLIIIESGLSQVIGSVTSSLDQIILGESGKSITIISITSEIDLLIYKEDGLPTVTVISSTSGNDIAVIPETGKAVNISSVTSASELQTMAETLKQTTIIAIVTETDLQTMIESGLSIISIGTITGTDDLIVGGVSSTGRSGLSLIAILEKCK